MKQLKTNLFFLLICALQILGGILILIYPFSSVKVYFFIFAFIFAACGILYITTFVIDKKAHYRPGWILPAGIISLITVIYVITGTNAVSESAIVLAAGFITLVTGIALLVSSIQYRYLEIKRWWIFAVNSLPCIAAGAAITMFNAIPETLNHLAVAVPLFILAFITFVESFVYIRKR